MKGPGSTEKRDKELGIRCLRIHDTGTTSSSQFSSHRSSPGHALICRENSFPDLILF